MLHKINPADHGPLGEAMEEAVRACVHCGFCLAECPTYQELGQEMDSPRGRIVLMKKVLENELDLEACLPHLDQCLGCLACETACPSGVAYRNLISPFRALTKDRRRRPLIERLRHTLISKTLPYPRRFRIAAAAGKIGKAVYPLLPKSFQPMLNLLPDQLPPRQAWPEISPAQGKQRARVALLIGCAQQVLDPETNTATIDVLTRNGVEVLIPPSQQCCGALAWHVGALAAARKFAKTNLVAFPEDVDAIITNAAGCGSALHEYHLILKGTAHEEEAQAFRHKVQDVTAFLHELGDLEPIPAPEKEFKIAYHDACHLSHAQGIRNEPRSLLAKIPGASILEIHDPQLCCGSAGTYNIDQPEIAHSLGSQKARHIIETGADLIATGNIGCLTQIKTHLSLQGATIPIRHTVAILADAYANRLA
jgi:glycolate oxidase iron-sulfur subunit